MSRSFFLRRVFWTAAFVAIFLFTACCPCKDISTSHNESDSVRVEIRWREVKVHDTVPFYIPVEVYGNVTKDTSRLETTYAKSMAFVDSTGLLHHTLENKARQVDIPVEVGVPVTDTSHYESHSKTDSIFVPTPYPVEVAKPLTWFQKTLMYTGAVCLLCLLLWIAMKIINKVNNRK